MIPTTKSQLVLEKDPIFSSSFFFFLKKKGIYFYLYKQKGIQLFKASTQSCGIHGAMLLKNVNGILFSFPFTVFLFPLLVFGIQLVNSFQRFSFFFFVLLFIFDIKFDNTFSKMSIHWSNKAIQMSLTYDNKLNQKTQLFKIQS